MILNIKVIPRAKVNDVMELTQGYLKVHLCAPAVDNKANKALVEILAKYYAVKKNQVAILRGERSQDKVVEINPNFGIKKGE